MLATRRGQGRQRRHDESCCITLTRNNNNAHYNTLFPRVGVVVLVLSWIFILQLFFLQDNNGCPETILHHKENQQLLLQARTKRQNRNQSTTTAIKHEPTTTTTTRLNDTVSSNAADDEEEVEESVGNYVVFSTTISDLARDMDYAYLAPIVARNWNLLGFRPILFVAASSQSEIDRIRPLWDIILPAETRVIPIVPPNHQKNKTIPLAQIARLYGASIISSLHDDSFLRTTDADVLLFNPIPFEPPPLVNIDDDDNKTVTIDITIYSGDCCLGNNSLADGRVCNQFPMHSPGMKVSLWRKLFPLPAHSNHPPPHHDDLAASLDTITEKLFPNYSTKAIRHADSPHWFMDQIMLGCAVDDAIRQGYTVALEEQQARMHVEMEVYDVYVDAHLASFKLNEHYLWMDHLVENSILLMWNRDKYRRYTDEWVKFHDIQLKKFNIFSDDPE